MFDSNHILEQMIPATTWEERPVPPIVTDTLRQTLTELEAGDLRGMHAVVILLDDTAGDYGVGMVNSDLETPALVKLLDTLKAKVTEHEQDSKLMDKRRYRVPRT